MRNPSFRMVVLAAAAIVLAIVAGTMATRAFAANVTYCNNCTLPSSGVPAVGPNSNTYSFNSISTVHFNDEQIYMYDAGTNITSCSLAADNVNKLGATCTPSTAFATARCHLLHGTGPDTAICQAQV